MERLKYYDQYVQEAFVADINDAEGKDKNKKNTLDVELPDEKKRRVFKLNDKNKPVEIDTEGEREIDSKTKPYVSKVIDDIRDLKNIEKAKEIERISGDDPIISKEIRNLYDGESTVIRCNKPDSGDKATPDKYTLWEELESLTHSGKSPYTYISLGDLTEDQKDWFTKTGSAKDIDDIDDDITYVNNGKGIGKGEYFLPILYTDVYKTKAIYKTPGDNYLKTPEGKEYELELKSAGAFFPVDPEKLPIRLFTPKSEKSQNEWKDFTSKKIATYLKGRNLKNKPLFLIIFDDTGNDDKPNGFWALYVGKTLSLKGRSTEEKDKERNTAIDELQSIISEHIEIDKKSSYGNGFTIRYSNDSKKIIVSLSKSLFSSYGKSDSNLLNQIVSTIKTLKKSKEDCTIDNITSEINKSKQDGEKDITPQKIKEICDENDIEYDIRTYNSRSSKDLEIIKKELSKDKRYEEINKLESKRGNLIWKTFYIYFKYLKDDSELRSADLNEILGENGTFGNYISKAKAFIKSDIVKNLKNIVDSNEENIDDENSNDNEFLSYNLSQLKSIWIYELATGKNIFPKKIKDEILHRLKITDVDDIDVDEIKELDDKLSKRVKYEKDTFIKLVQSGKTPKEIATELGIKNKEYVGVLARRYGVKDQLKLERDYMNPEIKSKILDLRYKENLTPIEIMRRLKDEIGVEIEKQKIKDFIKNERRPRRGQVNQSQLDTASHHVFFYGELFED